uniref:Polyprotein protein n=1 Tax=Solanum tuberosum TaxID=4113 RepID=M1DXT6_SOLTU
MAGEGGAPATSEIPPTTTGDVQMGDAVDRASDAEIDEDLAAAHEREEEDNSFGNLSSLVENIVQSATQTSPGEKPTAALTGPGTVALTEVTPGTDAHTQTADQRTDVPTGGKAT